MPNPFTNVDRANERRVTHEIAASVYFTFNRDNHRQIYVGIGETDRGQYFSAKDLVELADWLVDEAIRMKKAADWDANEGREEARANQAQRVPGDEVLRVLRDIEERARGERDEEF